MTRQIPDRSIDSTLRRGWLLAVIGLALGTSSLMAQQQAARRGTIKELDAAQGAVTITSDGRDLDFTVVVYVEDDLREDDRTHESPQGQDKVGRELVRFFKADPTAQPWFIK